VLFYWRMVSGRWLWKYPRKNAVTIAQSENNSANDRKLSGFDSVRRIVNIRPVHTIPL
jgi:hypothetical protein